MDKKMKFLILIISIIFMLSVSCFEPNVPTETPQPPQSCGTGTGTYTFSANNLPLTFDCNSAGSFGTEVSPTIDGSYAGFNRLYFELKKDSKTYRSNYVEFYSYNTATQQLEFGGSLPTGEYTGRAYLRNIQLNSSCTDKIYQKIDWWVGNVYITQFSNPQKVMNIEYFCQDSDTSIIDRYDVFLSPNTEEYMNIAFNIANTRDSVITYSNNQLTSLVEFEPIFRRRIIDYIYTFKVWGNEMFLCGIKGFKDPIGNYLPQVTGVTYFFSNPVAPCSTGSLVAVKACIDLVANEYKIDYNDFVTATTIHELGHQRASILHEDYHDSQFCTMHLGLVVIGERNRYSNPHFCNSCINRLKNIIW